MRIFFINFFLFVELQREYILVSSRKHSMNLNKEDEKRIFFRKSMDGMQKNVFLS